MMAKLFLLLGTVNAGLCVILGAFAAHKLKTLLSETSLATFQTGVQYHFYHSFALIVVGIMIVQANAHLDGIRLEGVLTNLRYAGLAFMLGILLFSGSLYGLSTMGWKILGPITPLGGLLFIIAWFLLAKGIYKGF